MPRDIPVGNGRVLVAFDRDYQVRDMYFPNVGKENQAGRDPCKMGVWADGEFSWMGPEWIKTLNYRENTLVTDVVARNDRLGIELHFADCVDSDEPTFIREVRVKDLRGSPREVRLFFHYDFNLYGCGARDTACYDTQTRGVLHYNDKRFCLVNTSTPTRFGVDQYAVGVKGMPGMQGTWRDAEDGQLSGNASAFGNVDSTVGINLTLEPFAEEPCYTWVTFGYNYSEVKANNTYVWEKSPAELIRRTNNFWLTWAKKEDMNLEALPEQVRKEFIRSLLILRTQTDIDGAIVSGNDSEALRYDCDSYSYVWPREAAIVAMGLDAAGYADIARSFYLFCAASQAEEGFMLPKYLSDGAVGPILHPWVQDGVRVLPIQEDETALTLFALWKHFELYRDLDFIDPIYHTFIVESAEFLADHIDHETDLPLSSYDLWEERFGVHTFTVSAVIGGLWAGAKFAQTFGDDELARKYNTIADKMKAAMVKYLYHNDLGRFARSAYKIDGAYDLDMTIDTQLIAIWAAGVFPPDDPRVISTMEQVRQTLFVQTDIGGMARYQNDLFLRADPHLPGNPWIVCTAWLAQWEIERARNVDELGRAMPLIEWVCQRALPSGVLPEQVNPHTGEPISVSPSTFAHGKLVHVVMLYLEKLERLEPERTHRRRPQLEIALHEIPHIAKAEVKHLAAEFIEAT